MHTISLEGMAGRLVPPEATIIINSPRFSLLASPIMD
jgi:hypothetical protein